MTGKERSARIEGVSEPLSLLITFRTALESNPCLHIETPATDRSRHDAS